jgi:hypothetical protein
MDLARAPTAADSAATAKAALRRWTGRSVRKAFMDVDSVGSLAACRGRMGCVEG